MWPCKFQAHASPSAPSHSSMWPFNKAWLSTYLFVHSSEKKGPPSFMTGIVVINTPPLFPQPQTEIHPLSCSQENHMFTYWFVWDSVRTAVCLHQSNLYFPSITITGHSSLPPDFTSLFLHCQRSDRKWGQDRYIHPSVPSSNPQIRR